MKYGLTEKQINEIREIIASYPEVDKAIIFGSRAIDTFKEASDVDIAIVGEKCDLLLIAKIKDHLEDETYLPFFFDIIACKSIKSPELKKHIQTKGKILFQRENEWKEVKIDSIAKVVGGGTPKTSRPEFWNGNIPWLTPRDLTGYSKVYILKGERSITEEGLKGSSAKLLPAGSVLLSSRAPIGYIAIAENEICTNQGFKSLVVKKDKANNLFIYYWLKSNVDYLKSNGTGTTFSEISGSVLKELDILLPPLPEQKAIAEVLSSLDDKIDLLNRQNKTLEEMAETLFRQWFIEEADERWEERPLSYFGKIICGKTPSKKRKDYYGGNVPFIKIPDMHDTTYILHTTDSLSEQGNSSQLNKGLPPKSICVSCIATVGLVAMNTIESHTNQQINSIIPYKDEYRFYIYLKMKESNSLLHSMASGGTATLNLNTSNFSKMKITLPPYVNLLKFKNHVESIFDKILFNQLQINQLTNLRDTLLPKLMCGDVRIKIAEKGA